MSKLEVEGLTKTYYRGGNVHVVLDGTSLSVQEGEFITILGPSGCGKTTLLSIIAGFQRPDAGMVKVGGQVVTRPGPDRGYVFQHYALFPWMTVRDNIMYPMNRQKISPAEKEKRLRELLALAHLQGQEGLFPHQLSGGMKQRTAVLRALACRPEVLLMDEPLGAVDLQMRQRLQEELELVFRKDRVTVIMVSHDVEEAVYMSDRVLLMSRDRGQIVADIAVQLRRPRERRNRQFQDYVQYLISLLENNHCGREPVAGPKCEKVIIAGTDYVPLKSQSGGELINS